MKAKDIDTDVGEDRNITMKPGEGSCKIAHAASQSILAEAATMQQSAQLRGRNGSDSTATPALRCLASCCV